MPATNRRQALVPEGARLLPNRFGTAPGFAAVTGVAPTNEIAVETPLETTTGHELAERLGGLFVKTDVSRREEVAALMERVAGLYGPAVEEDGLLA